MPPQDAVQLINMIPRQGFVEMRGGGYYFLPSITALRYLSA